MRYLLSLLLLSIGVATADAPLPDTPAGKILGHYLVMFNSGDVAQVNAFNERHGRVLVPPDRILDLRAMSGGLTLLRVLESEPLKIVALLQEKDTERPMRIELTATGGDAPVVETIGLRGTQWPPDLAPPRLPQ